MMVTQRLLLDMIEMYLNCYFRFVKITRRCQMNCREAVIDYIVCVRAQSCLTLCDPMDYSPPDSTVFGIF